MLTLNFSETRMDNIWAMRAGYEKARQIKQKQDDYCQAAIQGQWEGLGDFPEDLQWESMVDILRGKVKVHNHCYETVCRLGSMKHGLTAVSRRRLTLTA
jgi:hypothetical protein